MNIALRQQLLRAITRDVPFLKAVHTDIDPAIFPEPEERVIAQAALQFYENYGQSIGPLLVENTDELAKAEKFNVERKKKLAKLRELIQGGRMEVTSIKALEDKVKRLKQHAFYDNALEEIIKAYEEHKLDSRLLSEIVERAHVELRTNGFVASDYLEELEDRMERRKNKDETLLYPRLMLGPLDDKIHGIARGEIAMFLAPPASGKGLALIHLDIAYAFQGYNVLHITLEDPKDLVEDRLDANMARLAISRLGKLPNKLKNKYSQKKRHLKGKIKIIDGTDEGWTVTQIERAWEHERQNGFIADVVVIDYDDEIVCEKQFKGESGRRFEFAEIYRRLRRLAAKLNVIIWTAAQTSKSAESKKIITGKDVAEDYSKIRKVFLAIGIGSDKDEKDVRYLYVLRHRHDRSKFSVKIKSDYASGVFYDVEATNEMLAERVKGRAAGHS